jgi:hypothetical protein
MNNNNLPTIIDDNDDNDNAHLEVPPLRAPGPVRRDIGRAQEAHMHPYNQGQGVRNPMIVCVEKQLTGLQ